MHRFYCYLRLSDSYRGITVPVKLTWYSLLFNFAHTVYLLIEWEGRTGKYLARAGVRTHGPRAKYFSVRPDLTQSIIILSYDHFSFFIFIFFVKRGHARGSIASFRTHFQRNNKQRCELVIEAFRRPTVHRDNITVRMFAFTRFQENAL